MFSKIDYQSNYCLTQLGIPEKESPSPQTILLDPKRKESGMGFVDPGPIGFLAYCNESHVIPMLQTKIKDEVEGKLFQKTLELGGCTRDFETTVFTAEEMSKPSATISVKAADISIHKDKKKIGRSNSTDLKMDQNRLRKTLQIETGLKKSHSYHHTLEKKSSGHRGSSGRHTHRSHSKSVTSDPIHRKSQGKHEETSAERKKRKDEKNARSEMDPIVVKTLEDLPQECLSSIRRAGLDPDECTANLDVLLNVLRFRTGYPLFSSFEKIQERKNKREAERRQLRQMKLEELAKEGEGEDDEDNEDDSNLLNNELPPTNLPVKFEDPYNVHKIFQSLKVIGRGGYGTVYESKSKIDKCDVAIKKVLHVSKKQIRTNENEVGYLQYFMHPCIVDIKHAYLVSDECWIVMEMMQGGTIGEAVNRHRFEESQIAYVAREMLKAISYLHNHCFIHRDLKSANVMLSVEGKVKLIDFGLCVDCRKEKKKLNHMAGSPFWMPPEMIKGDEHGYPADIWSFAICLLELANRRPPMKNSSVKCMFTMATKGCPGLSHPERFSRNFRNFLDRCFEMDPSKRATAQELLEHPFLDNCDNEKKMKQILFNIFVSDVMKQFNLG